MAYVSSFQATYVRTVHHLSRVLEAIPDAVLEVTPAGRILLFNRAAVSMFQYLGKELLDLTLDVLVPALSLDGHSHTPARPAFSFANVVRELPGRKKDGSVFPIELTINTITADALTRLVLIRDITERRQNEEAARRSEEKVRQTQRIEAIARLTAGMAHEFNNLMAIIKGYSDLTLQDHSASADDLKSWAEGIRDAAQRAAELTRQLVSFSQRQKLSLQILDLNSVLSDARETLAAAVGRGIEVTVRPAPASVWVVLDPMLLCDVMAALAAKARDAMPAGGHLTIEIDKVTQNPQDANGSPDLPAGDYVLLAVKHTGEGLSAAAKAGFFEPFFTIDSRNGSGLGLASVYGAIRQNGGAITLESEPGTGTVFHIYLPTVKVEEGICNLADGSSSAPQ